jgi:aryl-alcohol dehydrogenase-like predicted oxidoreductase
MRRITQGPITASALTLGCNSFGERLERGEAHRLVRAALELGITTFDTAAHYGHGASERFLGEALGADRDRVLIASKCGLALGADGRMTAIAGRGRRAFITAQCEASLRRLGTERIDLYFLHRHDPDTPLEETAEAMEALRAAGKIGWAGFCNVPAGLLARFGAAGFALAQYEYSLANRDVEAEVIPALSAIGAGLMCYFPLAGGLLSGKYRRDAAPPPGSRFDLVQRHADRFLTAANWRLLEAVRGLAEAEGRTVLDYAIGWLASRPRVLSVIAGASSPEQLAANARAAQCLLSASESDTLERISAPLSPS